ncbi:MAG: hypothetical protein V1790_17525 [Planctomycetota bacterium]
MKRLVVLLILCAALILFCATAYGQEFGSTNATRIRGRNVDPTAPTNLQTLLWRCVVPSAVFTGAGLNDASAGGTCTAATASLYEIVISSSAASPDEFKWRQDGGALSAAVPMTGAAQTLADEVTITFKATDGHTLADAWAIATTVSWVPSAIADADAVTGAAALTAGDVGKLTKIGPVAGGIVPSVAVEDGTGISGPVPICAYTGTAHSVTIVAQVDSVVFTGAGLNDATSAGTYIATGCHTYTVIVDGTGTPDTFKWRKDAGSWTNTVSMTGSPQTLIDGVTATFKATTGHTLADQWVIHATSSDNGKILTFNNAAAITLTIPASLGIGFNALIVQLGVGNVTPTVSSTTLYQRQAYTKTAGAYAVASLLSYVADIFVLSGDLQ